MKIKREHVILAIIFALTLGARLYFAFQSENFSQDAYFTLRYAKHIKEKLVPFYHDDLSYGGRALFRPPLFYYMLAFFNLFLPIGLVGKLLPNIFASSLVIIVYLIAKEITKNKEASLFTAFISGFIPVFFSKTLNNISVYSFMVPLTFYTLYCLIKMNNDKRYIYLFIFFLAVLRLSHASVSLLIIALLFYLLIIKIGGLKESRAEIELILFSTFIIVWSLFVTFKNAFLIHGPSVIWQNIPAQILTKSFSEIGILGSVYQIGVVPLVFGVYIVYKYTFKEKNKQIYLLMSFALSMFILLWLKLVKLEVGLMFLGVILVLLFSQFYKLFFLYLEKTRFFRYKKIFLVFLILVFIFTSLIPSFSYAHKTVNGAVTDSEINALLWLKGHSKKGDVILSTLGEGFLIPAVANRKNVADSNFLLIKDAEQRLYDIERIYSTLFETEAIKLLNKYNVSYIYFSDRAKKEFSIEKLRYANTKCFELVYDKDVKIYKCLCSLEEEQGNGKK